MQSYLNITVKYGKKEDNYIRMVKLYVIYKNF